MAVDITTLGIQIDLLNGEEALKILDQLTAAATRAGNAGHGLSQRSQAASGSINTLQNTANSASSALSQATQRLLGFNTATGNLNSVSRSASASMNRMEDSAKNLANSLQQAAKSALAYFAAYKSITGLDKLISDGFAYNEQIEKAQLGIAAVIASTMDLVDAQGQVLKAQEKFNAAQKMSVEMAKALDVASMQSPAGYTHLLSTFQAMLAPANQLGLKWQDTLDITIKMSNVLSALGIDMERLGAETKAILTGKNISQSAVAQRLGISKEEIQSWKTGIELMDKFQERFEAFKYAGVAVEDTMEAVREYYEDVIKNASGDAFTSLWTSAKETMLEVADAFYVIDEETGKFKKTEEWEALSSVIDSISKSIGNNLVSAVKSGVSAFQTFGKYINEVGSDEFLSDMGAKAQIASSGLLALVAARKAATAEFVIANGVEQQHITGLGNYTKTVWQSQKALVAERDAAKTAMNVANQRLQAYRNALPAIQAYNERNLTATSLAQARAQSQAHLTRLINEATAAEARYKEAVTASSIATRAANALKAAGMGLVNMLGGPLGIALTAVTVGVSAYMMSASKASEATKTLEKAQESWSAVMRQCIDENGKLKEELSSTQRMMLEMAQEDALKSWKTDLREFTKELNDVVLTKEQVSQMSETSLLTANFDNIIPQSVIDHFNGLIRMLKEEGPSATEKFVDGLANLRTWLKEAGYGETELTQKIEELSKKATSENGILHQAQKLDILSGSAKEAAASIRDVKNAMAGGWNIDTKGATSLIGKMEEEIRSLQLKRENITGTMAELGKLLPEKSAKEIGTLLKTYHDKGIGEFVKGIKNYAELSSEQQINIVSTFDAVSRLQTEKTITESWEKRNREAQRAASSGAKAAVAQSDYNAEIKKTKNSIVSLEEQLGAGKAEILTQAIAKAEKEYNDAIIETNKNLANRVIQGKLTQAQADTLRVEKEKEASLKKQLSIKQAEQKQDQKNIQLAQGQIKFYKELGQLSGNYANTVDLQNMLLEQQAAEYVKTYQISQDLVDQWLYFQQLQISTDPFDGAYRGLLKFVAEYGDSAKQWENITYNFGKNFMSTTRDMFDDFLETGKASFDGFKNLFKQLLKDLAWQAIAQPIMLSVISGVTGMAGSVSTAQAGTAQGGLMGIATGASSGGSGDLVNSVLGYGQQAALGEVKNQLFGSSGSLMSGITSSIDEAMASWFPSSFATTANANLVGPMPAGIPKATFSQQASSVMGAFTAPALGASLGSMASPFVNSLLGLENNQGSQTGSMIGGLGSTAVLGTLAAANIWNPGGWIMGGLAAIGSLLGGGIGSLFGGGKQELPELYIHAGANLWENTGALAQTPAGAAALFNNGDDYFSSSFARAEGNQGTAYSTAQGVAEYLAGIIQSGQEMSAAIADTLGGFDKDMKSQYLDILKSKGRIDSNLYLEGKGITSESVEYFGEGMADLMQNAMVEALSLIDLHPLVKAADGKIADTAQELGKSIGNIVSFANLASSIDDEEMKDQFAENVIPQMTDALEDVSLGPLARTSQGFAVRTVDELATALSDVFSVYDVGESIEDESIRKAYQQWASSAIEKAFSGIDLSFLRVDFDRESVAGLQQAYAAIQAWQQVDQNIKAVLEPTTEFSSQLAQASSEFDGWLTNLRALGWQESAVSEIEAKRTDYMRELATSISEEFRAFMEPVDEFSAQIDQAAERFDDWIANLGLLGYTEAEIAEIEARRTDYLRDAANSISASFSAFIEPVSDFTAQITAAASEFDIWIANLARLGYTEEEIAEIEARRADYMQELAGSISDGFRAFVKPVSDFDSQMAAGAAQFDDWISNLQRLGYAESEIIEIEGRRAAYIEQLRSSLERSTAQDLSSRIASLRYGGNSNQMALQSLLFQQANERESLKSQYGEGHYLYQAATGIQKAEMTSTLLEQLRAEREKLLQQEQQAARNRISAEQQGLQARNSALQSELNAAKSVADTFRRIVKTLEEYRRELWSGGDNLSSSRYADAYSQFNSLYQKAMAGDEEAFNEITGKASELLELGREQLPERGEYRDLFYDVDQKLKIAQAYSEKQANSAEGQAGLLQAQIDLLQGQQDTLSGQLAALQTGNDTASSSLMTLEQIDLGIGALEAVMQAQLEEARKTYASGATISYDWDRLLQDKANAMNAGKTLAIGQTAGGWTPEKVLAEMQRNNLTPAQWYELYGKQEGFVLNAASSITGTLDSSLSSLDDDLKYYLANNAKLLDGSLDSQYREALAQGLSLDQLNAVQGAYWPRVIENLLGLKTGMESLDSSFLTYAQKLGATASASATGSANISPATSGATAATGGGTGIYGSKYIDELHLLGAKRDRMNAEAEDGRTNWNVISVRQKIEGAGLTVQQWYERYGKAEGFASGGITPASEPFWVGEHGKELMVAKNQWGVINHEASMALMEKRMPVMQDFYRMPESEDGGISRSQMSALISLVRQLLEKTDRMAYACQKLREIVDKWDKDGQPPDRDEIEGAVQAIANMPLCEPEAIA